MSFNGVATYKEAREKDRDVKSDSDSRIQAALDSAQEIIETELCREFGVQGQDTYQFVYDVRHSVDIYGRLVIPDFATVDSIDPPGTALRMEGKRQAFPYNLISFTTTPRHGDIVTVVGRRGWAAVPQAIMEAELEVAAILRLESSRSWKAGGALNDASDVSPQAQQVVARLQANYQWDPQCEARPA